MALASWRLIASPNTHTQVQRERQRETRTHVEREIESNRIGIGIGQSELATSTIASELKKQRRLDEGSREGGGRGEAIPEAVYSS